LPHTQGVQRELDRYSSLNRLSLTFSEGVVTGGVFVDGE